MSSGGRRPSENTVEEEKGGVISSVTGGDEKDCPRSSKDAVVDPPVPPIERPRVVPPPIPAAAIRKHRGTTVSKSRVSSVQFNGDDSRPASMILSGTSALSNAVDADCLMTLRSSESDAVSMSVSARSRTETMLQGIDFKTGYEGLKPFRSFYKNLRLEAAELKNLDHKLARDFEEWIVETVEEEIGGDSEGLDSIEGGEEFWGGGQRPRSSLEDRARALGRLSKKDGEDDRGMAMIRIGEESPTPSPIRQSQSSPSPPPSITIPSSFQQKNGSRPSSANRSSKCSSGGKKRGSKAFFFDLKKRIQTEDDRISRAAVYIKDAIHERPIKIHRSGVGPMKTYLFLQSKLWRVAMLFLSLVHLFLAFLEPSKHFDDGRTTYHGSFSYHDASFLRKVNCVELFIVFMYTVDVFLNVYSTGIRDYCGCRRMDRNSMRLKTVTKHIPEFYTIRWLHCFKACAVIAFGVDLWFAFQGGMTAERFSRLFRPLYVAVWIPELQRWGNLIARTVPHVWQLIVLLVVLLCTWSIAGVILFGGNPEFSLDDLQNFRNFGSAFIAMYVLYTTENYPDIQQPAYEKNKIYSAFFWSFLMVVMFFLGNLAIPTLYRAFKHNHHREALHGRILERTALLAAFQLLDIEKTGYLEVNQFKKVLRAVRPEMFQKVTGLEKIKGISKSMFRELARTDPDGQKLFPIDFFRVCEVILIDYKVKRENSSSDLFSRLGRKKFAEDFRYNMTLVLESEAFDRVILAICTVIVCICADYHNNSIMSNDAIDIIGNTWVGICVFEMALKIYLAGWGNFAGTWRNNFDFGVISWSFVCCVLGWCNKEIRQLLGDGNDFSAFIVEYRSNLGVMFIIIRTVRVIFVSAKMKKLRVILTIFPFMINSMAVTLLFLYFWALGGMYLYGDMDMVAPEVIACETEYQSSVDFTNFGASNMRLFQILTTSNWHLIMYTTMCVKGSRRNAWYFITFHLISVIILLQIVIAIYVEAFIAFQEREEELVAHEELRLVSDEESGEEGRGSITNMTLNQDEVNAVAVMRKAQFLKRSQMARSGYSNDAAGAGGGGKREVIRRRGGSMPGFVSPLNMVARMDMPAFEESEIAVLSSLGNAKIGNAAQKANEEEEELKAQHSQRTK